MKYIGFKKLMIRNVVITIIIPISILLILLGIMQIPFTRADDGLPANFIARILVAYSMMGLGIGYTLYALPAAVIFQCLFKMNFKFPVPEPQNIYGWISIFATYLMVSAIWAYWSSKKQKKEMRTSQVSLL